jgi:hypothetical protein
MKSFAGKACGMAWYLAETSINGCQSLGFVDVAASTRDIPS